MVACSHRGFRDWIVQRVTAVIMIAYTLFLFSHLLCDRTTGYAGWQALFQQSWVRWATVVVVISLLWHAWIGLWTVFTDYVKCTKLRFILEAAVLLLLVAYMVWSILILW